MTDATAGEKYDHDVVVVGGGPAGCSAGVFTARYGLDTAIFDRGNAALRRCAYLENYLGFPAGIDVDTFYALIRDHAEEAGCTYVPDMVRSVQRTGEGAGFVVETQDGRSVTTERLVAAAWYDGDYLRPLGGDDLFEHHEHHGETHERFDPDYPDSDGRTPIDGLYVAAPAGDRNDQAIIAAGHGAHVARCLLEDYRRTLGYPEGVAEHYDWLRPSTEFTGEWGERDRWREWYENQAGDGPGLDEAGEQERFVELREAYIDRSFETRRSPEECERLAERGYERLLDHLDDEQIRAYLDRAGSEQSGHD